MSDRFDARPHDLSTQALAVGLSPEPGSANRAWLHRPQATFRRSAGTVRLPQNQFQNWRRLRNGKHELPVSTGRKTMARKRDSKPKQGKPEQDKSVSRRNFLTQGAVAGVGAAALGGSVGEASAQGDRRRRHQVGLRGGRRRHRLGCFRPALRHPGARRRPARARRSTRTSTSAARCCTAAARSRSAAATRASCATSPGEGDKEGFIKVAPLHKPEDMTGGRRLPVQGHHRLVGARRRRRTRPTATTTATCIAPGPTTATARGNS